MDNPVFKLWLEHEHVDGPWDYENEFINMSIELQGGKRYALNVWTYNVVRTLANIDKREHQYLDGGYLLPPDLLVETLKRDHLENVVVDLIRTNRLRKEWEVTD